MADELSGRLDRLRIATDALSTAVRAETREAAFERTLGALARRRRLNLAGAAATALCVALGVAWRVGEARNASERNPETYLADGSRLSALAGAPPPRWRVLSTSPERVELSLDEGAAHFAVRHLPTRRFVVHLGSVTVEVLGTTFDLERAGDLARVSVEEGRVRVSRGAHALVLTPGETAALRADPEAPAPSDEAPGDAGSADVHDVNIVTSGDVHDVNIVNGDDVHSVHIASSQRTEGERGWRHAARRRAWGAAWQDLEAVTLRDVEDTADDLVLAGAVAAHSGHPGVAVTLLGRLLDRHADDPRAPQSAVTLARLMLGSMGDPRGAARAFASARAMGARLSVDEAIDEVEALQRSGDRAGARRRAAALREGALDEGQGARLGRLVEAP
ncbi:MAG: FecR domain-containing protein [Myxococcales bacterium]|nr:FecR domain-containing protein [Myxococcales bacterium]